MSYAKLGRSRMVITAREGVRSYLRYPSGGKGAVRKCSVKRFKCPTCRMRGGVDANSMPKFAPIPRLSCNGLNQVRTARSTCRVAPTSVHRLAVLHLLKRPSPTTTFFRAILRHDVGWFDKEEHSVGTLTTQLEEDTAKVWLPKGRR